MDKITLVNGWHDDNKGDSAIVIATMKLLQAKRDDIRFGLVSELDLGKDDIIHAYRHVLSAIGPISITPRILTTFSPSSAFWRYPSALNYLRRFLVEASRTAPSTHCSRQLIAQSDLVISKGGHMLHARKSNPIHWANLYSHLYPLVLSRKYMVPYAIWGHSLGPFADRLSLSLTSRVLANAELVAVREKISYDIALQMDVPRDKLRLIPDPAFAIEPHYSERLKLALQGHGLLPNDFIAVTVRPWLSLPRQDFGHYLDGIAKMSRRLVDRGLASHIAVVVHAMGPNQNENDLVASKMLMERLRDAPAILVDDDFSPEELCALYGQSRFVIGTRFHSVILALAAGTPAYAISYFGPKAVGMMQDLGMGEWVTAINALHVDKTVEMVLRSDLNDKRDEIIQKVRQYRKKLRDETNFLLALQRNGHS